MNSTAPERRARQSAKVRWPTPKRAAIAAPWSPKPNRSTSLSARSRSKLPTCRLRPKSRPRCYGNFVAKNRKRHPAGCAFNWRSSALPPLYFWFWVFRSIGRNRGARQDSFISASTVAPVPSRLGSRERSALTIPASATTIEPKATRSRATADKTAAPDSGPTEYATAYVPLPYAYDPSHLEGGAVVRVVLPRAALISYGLPVEAMGVSDQVTADMVVSEDGTPQAIRLVAQGNPATDD